MTTPQKYEDEPWIRAQPRRKKKPTLPPVLRTIGLIPPVGLSDLVDDDELSILRRKFHHSRVYFTYEGSRFVDKLIKDVRCAFSSVKEPQSVDILCLGLGNPAVDPASLRQLALLDILIERDDRFSKYSTKFYDPVLRSVARHFISELGMQVLDSNEEAHYSLSQNRHHFIFLPHCAPILLENLLSSNWNPQVISRMVLFSNNWHFVRDEIRATGEPDHVVSDELACISALESVIKFGIYGSQDANGKGETYFEGMSIQWFDQHDIRLLPSSTWDRRIYDLPSARPITDRLQSDLISKAAVSTFIDFCSHDV